MNLRGLLTFRTTAARDEYVTAVRKARAAALAELADGADTVTWYRGVAWHNKAIEHPGGKRLPQDLVNAMNDLEAAYQTIYRRLSDVATIARAEAAKYDT